MTDPSGSPDAQDGRQRKYTPVPTKPQAPLASRLESAKVNTGPYVSLFENAFAKAPVAVEVPLSEVLSDIKNGRYQAEIATLRQLLAAGQDKEYDRKKKELSAFTMSGTCTDRKTPGAHSGLLQVDVDDLGDVVQVETLRLRLQQDRHIALGFVSPSGQGLKLGLSIDGTRHRESFFAAERYFATTYNLPIDPKVKDRLRLCFVSHDPELWINQNAKILPVVLQSKPEPTEVIDEYDECVSDSVLLCKGSESYSVKSVADAVRISLPTAPRRNNASLFKLARGLLSIEGGVTTSDRMRAFDLWYEQTRTRGFLRNGQGRDHYLVEFMRAIRDARCPLTKSVIDAAWERVQTEGEPPEAGLFKETPHVQRLVALCYQVHRLAAGKPWFLSCRDAAQRVGLSHARCAAFLRGFCGLGLLAVAEPGTRHRATRYIWKGGS